jgi:peptidoglycan/xylan/chitin deacetylase (PgdA/CDA1 family)
MKAIMYHYVRPFNLEYPNLKNLHIDDFRKQLDYFQDEYGFVSKEEFVNSFKTGKPIDGVILTFDDGLSCHYEYVYTELKKRGLWGIFYIPTQPYVESKILDVHRTHLLLGKHESKTVFEFLDKRINNSLFDHSKLDEFRELTYKTQENDQYTLLVKRILNYFISYEHREKVMNLLMEEFICNEKEILESYYLTENQILEMHENNMIIGSHTINHPVMSRLSFEEQSVQVKNSFNFLEGIIGKFHHKTFCYPYGGFHSFTDETEKILSKENCLYSFNVEQRDIENIDLKSRPQALPRYDCNQFPFGQVRELSPTMYKRH